MSVRRKGKVFRLYTKPNVTLYDYDLQEVPYKEVLDDGWVKYVFHGVWNEKLEAYVTRTYYLIEYMENPFVRYVYKIMCVSDMPFDYKGDYRCEGGRAVYKMVMEVRDKRFKELCELL